MIDDPLTSALYKLVVAAVREVLPEVLVEQQRAQGLGAELLTTAEASRIAKVKASTIRTWAREGLLHAHRIGPRGRGLRIARADLDAFLALGGRRGAKRETADAWARREAGRALASR